ncbi:MAG: ribokinase, partial [Streptosporangiaceae bacterium]|nr:ribokinase [Streptosporangiaceae bacterium]
MASTPRAPRAPRLAVLGSLNMDISVRVERLPVPGATVLGPAASFAPGGKGANQAVAASRLGGSVLMAGCVGADDFGRQLTAGLRAEGVDTAGVRTVPGVPSGLAMITVDADGENIITVAQGANHEVGDAEVASARAGARDALIISAEVPVPAIRSALSGAGRPSALTMLNLAPAPKEAAEIVAAGADWLVVNETEAAAVLGRPVAGLADAAGAAAGLASAGARNAVVTAGAAGAAMSGEDVETATVPGFEVRAVDSVGAGDTFAGALAVALAA